MAWTKQPVQYGLPGPYPNVQYGQQPGYPQMQMMQSVQQSSNTTVVLNQQPQRPVGTRDWSTGIFGCLEDASSCKLKLFLYILKMYEISKLKGMMTCCCTPYYSCFLAVELGESCCLPMCFCPGECIPLCGTSVPWLVALRVKLREANKIKGNIMGDCIAVCCCPLCVMCQLKREHDFTRQHPNNE